VRRLVDGGVKGLEGRKVENVEGCCGMDWNLPEACNDLNAILKGGFEKND
jgi:hypothetical protein